jgi:hypothetical protein
MAQYCSQVLTGPLRRRATSFFFFFAAASNPSRQTVLY